MLLPLAFKGFGGGFTGMVGRSWVPHIALPTHATHALPTHRHIFEDQLCSRVNNMMLTCLILTHLTLTYSVNIYRLGDRMRHAAARAHTAGAHEGAPLRSRSPRRPVEVVDVVFMKNIK